MFVSDDSLLLEVEEDDDDFWLDFLVASFLQAGPSALPGDGWAPFAFFRGRYL